jgi:hypothetical protein
MMHPHLPGPRLVAVPGIGYPQNISIGPEVLDPPAFGDLSDKHRDASTRLIDRILWLPSPRPWFAAIVRCWPLASDSEHFRSAQGPAPRSMPG